MNQSGKNEGSMPILHRAMEAEQEGMLSFQIQHDKSFTLPSHSNISITCLPRR